MNLVFALGYFVLLLTVIFNERRLFMRSGANAFSVPIIFVVIYILVPTVFIYSIIFFFPTEVTGNLFFDRTLANMDDTQSFTLLLLLILFFIGYYVVRGLMGSSAGHAVQPQRTLYTRNGLLAAWVALGFFLCLVFFMQLGGSFSERYANLILFRGADDSSERNFFSANVFSITQSFSWLCSGLTFLAFRYRRHWLALVLIGLTIFFSLLMGSRRAFIFPILIISLCYLLSGTKIPTKSLVMLIPPVLAWIAYGKEFTGSFAYRSDEEFTADGTYDSLAGAALRTFCDIGISQMQSLAVLQNFDFDPRFGIDHLLSFLRRIPFKDFLGLADFFPERITRITTETFLSAADLDIPPGMLGASWLDFPFLGAFMWGILLGAQSYVVEHYRRRLAVNHASAFLMAMILTIVAMPINTGSYDYTVSVDIVVLIFVLFTTLKTNQASDPSLHVSAQHFSQHHHSR